MSVLFWFLFFNDSLFYFCFAVGFGTFTSEGKVLYDSFISLSYQLQLDLKVHKATPVYLALLVHQALLALKDRVAKEEERVQRAYQVPEESRA